MAAVNEKTGVVNWIFEYSRSDLMVGFDLEFNLLAS